MKLTIVSILLFAALVFTLVSASGRAPLWIAVLLVILAVALYVSALPIR